MTDPLNGNNLVPVKSPLALTGVFLEIIRARFNPSYTMPWKWYPGDEGRTQSTIMIEAGGNEHVEDNDRRPGIFVIRNPIQFSQIGVGDREDKHFWSGAESFLCRAQTGFTFNCEAEEAGEAEIIADIVLSTVLMGQQEIARAFDFIKLGPFAMSAKAVTRYDANISQVSVQMGLGYDVKWASFPMSPILREIVVKMQTSTYNDSNTYFTDVYQESLTTRPKKPAT